MHLRTRYCKLFPAHTKINLNDFIAEILRVRSQDFTSSCMKYYESIGFDFICTAKKGNPQVKYVEKTFILCLVVD